jgi:hypothetical protein
MSWQGYVDQQLLGTGFVNKAAIIGLNGGVWAQSAGFAVLLPPAACLPLLVGLRRVRRRRGAGGRAAMGAGQGGGAPGFEGLRAPCCAPASAPIWSMRGI